MTSQVRWEVIRHKGLLVAMGPEQLGIWVCAGRRVEREMARLVERDHVPLSEIVVLRVDVEDAQLEGAGSAWHPYTGVWRCTVDIPPTDLRQLADTSMFVTSIDRGGVL